MNDWLDENSLGDPAVCVAVLDGPVDLSHPAFHGASLTTLATAVSNTVDLGLAAKHGTQIASVLFGQPNGPVRGIVPRCRGLIVPVFQGTEDGGVRPCSQLDLARGIAAALENGAHVINISGGQFDPTGEPEPLLGAVAKQCADAGVLIVAAAGNNGCECLQVPAAIHSVLAVGAMNDAGQPLSFSNWGESYKQHGILAPGENIPGAVPGGGVTQASGTSFATAIVSGVAAALLSNELKQGKKLDGRAIRAAILNSAISCDVQPASDCRRSLGGRLDCSGAKNYLERKSEFPMPENASLTFESGTVSDSTENNFVQPASCGCGGNKAPSVPPQKVYALGQIDYDFGSEANRDLFQQMGVAVPENRSAMAEYLTQFDKEALLPFPSRPMVETGSSAEANTILSWERSVKERLRRSQEPFPNQFFAERLTWVLVQDGTPIYAIQPMGAFAKTGYARLTEFLEEQTAELSDIVSLPGQVYGQIRLMNGQQVPVVIPDLRGLCNWSAEKLVASASTPADSQTLRDELLNYLHRTYFEIRNLGITSRDRAINFAATNILQVKNVFAQTIRHTILSTQLKLESIDAERSANCRPGADCWDIKLTFFDPVKRLEAPKQVFRFTIDVSEPLPVSIGPIRSWLMN